MLKFKLPIILYFLEYRFNNHNLFLTFKWKRSRSNKLTNLIGFRGVAQVVRRRSSRFWVGVFNIRRGSTRLSRAARPWPRGGAWAMRERWARLTTDCRVTRWGAALSRQKKSRRDIMFGVVASDCQRIGRRSYKRDRIRQLRALIRPLIELPISSLQLVR